MNTDMNVKDKYVHISVIDIYTECVKQAEHYAEMEAKDMAIAERYEYQPSSTKP